MKKIAAIVLFLAVSVCMLQAQGLSWNVRFVRGQSQESVPIVQAIRMETGDTFQITISSEADAFCYVLCYDSQRQLAVLNNDFQMRASQERLFGPMMINDPPGTETIYIIMSSDRQTQLEERIRSFNSQPDSRSFHNNLVREIQSLQNSVSRLGEPASVYIPSGGTTRGNTQAFVTRFSGRNLYVRAITIRH
ncbi:MAG: DUF4384 domain-containing protein [Treponema sp.]|nr:DUF4384 domain-containing protein [Treponema sp.]